MEQYLQELAKRGPLVVSITPSTGFSIGPGVLDAAPVDGVVVLQPISAAGRRRMALGLERPLAVAVAHIVAISVEEDSQ